MDKPPDFVTCSYTELSKGWESLPFPVLPVQTSNGHPSKLRFPLKLAYTLIHAMPDLYPPRSIMKLGRPEFVAAYRKHLDRVGVDAIREQAAAIRTEAGAGDVTLALLCYEQLHQPGKWCHRTVLAAWWQDHTQEVIPELGSRPQAETRAQEHQFTQESLW